jgi:polyribonucleotide nucleotidyltransferase
VASHEMSSQAGYFIEEKMEVFVGGRMLRFETGKIGRTADGSVTLTQGDTVVYSTACAQKEAAVGDIS